MSSHITFGGYRNRKRIARHAVEWFMEHRKLNRFNTFIHIIDRRTWHEKADGFCNSIDTLSRPRYFEIELDQRMNHEHYLTTLFHELRHVEQRLRGMHKQRYTSRVINSWMGTEVNIDTPYEHEPWEVDAHTMESVFLEQYNATLH